MEMDLHPCVSYGEDVEAEKTPFLSSGPQTDVMVDDVMRPWLSSSLNVSLLWESTTVLLWGLISTRFQQQLIALLPDQACEFWLPCLTSSLASC